MKIKWFQARAAKLLKHAGSDEGKFVPSFAVWTHLSMMSLAEFLREEKIWHREERLEKRATGVGRWWYQVGKSATARISACVHYEGTTTVNRGLSLHPSFRESLATHVAFISLMLVANELQTLSSRL